MRLQAGRRQQPRQKGHQRRDHIAQHQHRAHRNADIARRHRIVARIIDEAAPFGEKRRNRKVTKASAANRNTSTGTDASRARPSASIQWPGGTGTASCVISCERTKPNTNDPDGQGHENRRHIGIGHQKAVHQPHRDHRRQHHRQSGMVGHAIAQQLQIPRHRHRHDRHHRQVNAAADDHHRHAQRQNPQHRDRPHDRHQIARGQKPRQQDRCGDENADGDDQNDALLVQAFPTRRNRCCHGFPGKPAPAPEYRRRHIRAP